MQDRVSLELMQHVNVKLLASAGEPDSLLDAAIPVFHRWIQAGALPELLIDVADYRHVPDGPGVILIGHEANYSLDCSNGRLGLLYNRKSICGNAFEERLSLAYERAHDAARRLEREPEFAGRLSFDAHRCEVLINDRRLAPNNAETWALVRPELESFFRRLWGEEDIRLDWISRDPRERFRVAAQV
jgi:hypothetical protein